MLKEIFIIGIGGQGALTIGEILLIAANNKGFSASFYPFYGSQMRGGEAGCIVKIDTDGNEILNPTVNSPDDFIILSDKFFDKYKKFANANSNYYDLNSIGVIKSAEESLTGHKTLTETTKNLNIIMLKKYIDKSKLFSEKIIIDAIKEKFKKEEVYNNKIEIYKNS